MTSRLHAAAADDCVQEVVRLTQGLVRCRSAGFGAELDQAFSILGSYLKRHGIQTEVVRMDADAPLLRATICANRPGPHVLLEGHLDVVPADDAWSFDPFSGEVVDGWLQGRGSCDMKGGVAACAEAASLLNQRKDAWHGRVTLLVVPDEETGSDQGLVPYLERFGTPDASCAICAEPTDLDPYLGNRGLIWARIRLNGRASHAGMPQLGANPLAAAGTLITSLRSFAWSGNAATPTTLQTSSAINVIPAEAVMGLDLRLEAGEHADRALGELQQVVRTMAEAHPDVGVDVEVEKVWPPCLVERESGLAQTALRAARTVTRDAAFGFDQAANDASFLSQAGVPTLVWGPGAPGLAHARDERIQVSQLTAAVEMYVRFVELMSNEEAA
jgi:acetylornithine deacetylase/succinyl-diaminopimelate desuccinylase-like protein